MIKRTNEKINDVESSIKSEMQGVKGGITTLESKTIGKIESLEIKVNSIEGKIDTLDVKLQALFGLLQAN